MNKKISLGSLLLISIFAASLVGTVLARPFYKDISVEKASRLILSKGHHDLAIIDLRPAFIFASGHIPGAINVPVSFPPDWTILADWMASPEGQSHLNHKIVIHCLFGSASPTGAQRLIDTGFKKVFNMEGGFNAWVIAGYPTEPVV